MANPWEMDWAGGTGKPWEREWKPPTGAAAMRARGLTTDDTGTAEMNAQAESGVQGARDEAYVSENPIKARVDAFNSGLPFIGSWLDEAYGKIGGDTELQRAQQEAFSRARPGQDLALKLGGGVTGAIATAPLAIGGGAPSVARSMMIGGGAAGAEGAVYGAGLGEDGTRGESAAQQGVIQALLGAGIGGVLGGRAASVSRGKAIDAVPEVDELKGAAGVLYRQGEATGQTAARGYTQRLADGMQGVAQQEGLVLPSGELMGTYPKVSAALRMVGEYGGQKMAPDQMRQVRRVLQDAAQSTDAAEARIGSKMLKQFDQFVEPLVPEFKQADRLYARGMRGKEIEDTIALAKTRRSASDLALRNEFGSLERRGIRGDMTFPPELEEAVARVAQGSTAANAALVGGKAAPTGAVSAMGGLGLPFLVGNAIAGPPGGFAAAGASGGAGLLSKLLATRLTKNNAETAAAIARNGGALDYPAVGNDAMRAIIAALMARSATTGSQALGQ